MQFVLDTSTGFCHTCLMTRQNATATATRLMTEHLTDKGIVGWSFRLNTNKSRLGVCRFGPKSIEMSVYHVDTSDDASIINTMLHEIAHARVGRQHGHDTMWRLVALQLGCDGERCGSLGTVIPEALRRKAAYIGTCVKCGVEIPRYRASKRVNDTTAFHRACGPAGRITWLACNARPVVTTPSVPVADTTPVIDAKRAARIERSRQWHIRDKARRAAAE